MKPPRPPADAPFVLTQDIGLEEVEYFLFSSFGNDSIALIQWAYEKGLENVLVVHSDTGWAADWWDERIQKAEKWVRGLGYGFITIKSMGMVALARKKKSWPRNGMQFCTTELKIKPSKRMLEKLDPDKEATCMVGVRRVESRARRNWPEWEEESENHGGRPLWSPLAPYSDEQRDELIERCTDFDVLPHSSMECFPCINSSRADIRMLPIARVEEIARLEDELGFTSNGKKRTLFRPRGKMGAIGFREVYKWAMSSHGKYEPPVDLGDGVGCDSGMCSR